MKLSTEQKNKIKELLIGAKISYGFVNSYTGRREVQQVGEITDFYLKDIGGKAKWIIKTSFGETPFYNWCKSVMNGEGFKVSSKKIKDMAKAYVLAVMNKDDSFYKFLETLDGEFIIHDVDINQDEVEWLSKHVTWIRARFPSKYEKNFKKNFPGSDYFLDNDVWNYSFTMYFDDVTDIPDSLLTLKNKNGNSLDFDKKLMNNVSYIWKLVKDYPETFHFGKK